jgi:hypothetical protein
MPVSFLKDLASQKWSAITVEGVLLAANVYYLSSPSPSLWFALSALFVLSLISLQTVSRRFLLFYPVHPVFRLPTPRLDTYLLRLAIWLAMLFLAFGLGSAQLDALAPLTLTTTASQAWLVWLFVSTSTLLLVVLPVFWSVWGQELVKQSIVDEMQGHPLEQAERCKEGAPEPQPERVLARPKVHFLRKARGQLGKGRSAAPALAGKRSPHSRIVTKTLVSDSCVRITVRCEVCGYEFTKTQHIIIGY